MKFAVICVVVALSVVVSDAKKRTMVKCADIPMDIMCKHEHLQDMCEVPKRACKRGKVSFYNNDVVPSLEIVSNQNREQQNYNYDHTYGR